MTIVAITIAKLAFYAIRKKVCADSYSVPLTLRVQEFVVAFGTLFGHIELRKGVYDCDSLLVCNLCDFKCHCFENRGMC